MTRIVEILPTASIRSTVAKAKEGQSSCTRILKVNHGNNIKTVYAKAMPKPHQLLNEITGYILAKHLNLPTPNGFIIIASSTELEKHFEIQIKGDSYPLWATEQIDGNSAYIEFAACTTSLKKELNHWFNFHNTITFDYWIGNIDRNLGNLIRQSANNYQLIDHERIFGDRNAEDIISLLEKDEFTVNKLSYFCLKKERTPKKQKAVDGKLANDVSRHSNALKKAYPELKFWWNKILQGNPSQDNLYNYLNERGDPNNHIVCRKYNLLTGL